MSMDSYWKQHRFRVLTNLKFQVMSGNELEEMLLSLKAVIISIVLAVLIVPTAAARKSLKFN